MISNLKPHGMGILTKNMSDSPIVIKGKFENGKLVEEIILEEVKEDEILDGGKSPKEEEPGECDMEEPEINDEPVQNKSENKPEANKSPQKEVKNEPVVDHKSPEKTETAPNNEEKSE